MSMSAVKIPEGLRNAARVALEKGWTITRDNKGHQVWTSPEGEKVYLPSTPSDWRSIENSKRDLRAKGLTLPHNNGYTPPKDRRPEGPLVSTIAERTTKTIHKSLSLTPAGHKSDAWKPRSLTDEKPWMCPTCNVARFAELVDLRVHRMSQHISAETRQKAIEKRRVTMAANKAKAEAEAAKMEAIADKAAREREAEAATAAAAQNSTLPPLPSITTTPSTIIAKPGDIIAGVGVKPMPSVTTSLRELVRETLFDLLVGEGTPKGDADKLASLQHELDDAKAALRLLLTDYINPKMLRGVIDVDRYL